MVTLSAFVFIYVLGGISFIPLVVAAILLHAHLTFPTRATKEPLDGSTGFSASDAEQQRRDLNTDEDNLPEELKPRAHEPDVAAGYFAVCREYVPGGVNGKPPERTTPAGVVVANESPSVYQSMYRSIFDRNKGQPPSLDSANGKTKKARNVFFVVLRHGHLMLYDDSEQLDVRHVISLAYHDVDVFAGGEKIPEGELWIKRNCIRLTRRRVVGDITDEAKPFFLFSDNCSEKEDFYHAMLQNQERNRTSPQNPPRPLLFETSDIVKLVQQLHANEENLQTRWINALIGRLFLAMYKTAEIEEFIRMKITKKIARVPKPAFINSLKLQKIDMGDLPPFITNPKLKELTVDGDLTIEADVKYKGSFRLEIAAVARIELGSRFKPREVNLVLAGLLKKLEGHILIRVKPPPSNRLWISFETIPKMDISIEPIISSRQITYGVVLRAIESRIRETIAETLVLPNWDDIPFHDTMLQRFRGGIWADDSRLRPFGDHQTEAAKHGLADEIDKDSDSEESIPPPTLSAKDKTMSLPSLTDTPPKGLVSRKGAPSTISLDDGAVGVTSGAEARKRPHPKAIRSGSFASASSPVVNLDPSTVEALRAHAPQGGQDAASAMKIISSRSPPTSPFESPVGSPDPPSLISQRSKKNSVSSVRSTPNRTEDEQASADFDALVDRTGSLLKRSSASSLTTSDDVSSHSNTPTGLKHAHTMASVKSNLSSAEKRQALNQTLNSATAAAKKWFANRQQGGNSSADSNLSHHRSTASSSSVSQETLADTSSIASSAQQSSENDTHKNGDRAGSTTQPIGRGQPLPPPGTPLPFPEKRNSSWAVPGAAALASIAKRKPIPPPARSPAAISTPPSTQSPGKSPAFSFPKQSTSQDHLPFEMPPPGHHRSNSHRAVPNPPLPPRRKRVSNAGLNQDMGFGEGLMVVEAPISDTSTPNSPLKERHSREHDKGERVDEEGEKAKTPDEESPSLDEVEEGVFQAMDLESGKEGQALSQTGLGGLEENVWGDEGGAEKKPV
ncbi:hypothetical protein BU16DRAFT_567978 [Lophium mytilinum]|uniref:SMP-LTD domain-containing protein n=1 Tax=Lophium mytilinum TaxID=390894 RepID=A0A6A6QAD8_9PEZI|nr:hypothetical protein BU16DRAFT_567978 [Lophium mytilinum]